MDRLNLDFDIVLLFLISTLKAHGCNNNKKNNQAQTCFYNIIYLQLLKDLL